MFPPSLDTRSLSPGQWLSELPLESVIDIKGTLVEASVKSCTQSNVELQLERCYCVSRAANVLPFLLEDAARPEEEVDASQDTDRPFPRIGQEQRLDNRWLDLRVPANNAIMRVQSGVCTLFREVRAHARALRPAARRARESERARRAQALLERGFVEIHSPKLIPGESEGGSEVFRTDYFGSPACLAQSPQLYKQMAIAADLERVFEVGPVFRAENSNTRRHLCEFTGLDFEMGIHEHYNEVLRVAHATFTHIFSGLESRYARELAVVREQVSARSGAARSPAPAMTRARARSLRPSRCASPKTRASCTGRTQSRCCAKRVSSVRTRARSTTSRALSSSRSAGS